jgi:putative aldouronate transport system permease protein
MVKLRANPLARSTGTDLVFDAVNGLFLLAISVVTAYPILYVLSASFSSPGAVTRGAVWLWPVDFSLEGYKAVFRNGDVVTGYANSLIYMVSGTAINVSITLMAGYALAQKELPGRKTIMFLFTFTLLFSGGIIPLYLVTKSVIGVNNRWDMILPNAMSIANLIIARTFIQQTIPAELRESAKMDGADDFRFFFSVVIPLSGPIIAVLTLLYALSHWNSFFFAFIFLQSRKLLPLQIVLRNILIMNETAGDSYQNLEYAAQMAGRSELLKFSLIVVSSVPVLILYPIAQKNFVKGIMIGSIKG